MKLVLTGGPCSGKSTLLDSLKKRGYPILAEAARDILPTRAHIPVTPEEQTYRQRAILALQLEREAGITHGHAAFLDRGVIDNIGYCRHFEIPVPDDLTRAAWQADYTAVFALDLLPFTSDAIRTETAAEAKKLHAHIVAGYRAYGYLPVAVPPFSIEARADFVLDHMYKLKGGGR